MNQAFPSKFYCFRVLLLGVFYTLFFLVELLHNFETNQVFSFTSGTNIKKSVTATGHPGQEIKYKIRLNKRFQPSFIPFTLASVATAAFCLKVPVTYTTVPHQNLHQPLTGVSSLRAPPVS